MVDGNARSAGLLLSDTSEKKRGSFFVGDDGVVSVTLLDRNEKPELGLGGSKTGPVLIMSDTRGNLRVGLGLFSAGPALKIWNENGSVLHAVP